MFQDTDQVPIGADAALLLQGPEPVARIADQPFQGHGGGKSQPLVVVEVEM